MTELGVKWKAQPIDSRLRERTIAWINSEIIPDVGLVSSRFLMSVDTGLTYTERVYEGGDFETKVSMVKYVSVAIYLDDMIDKDSGVAKEAEAFLVNMMDWHRDSHHVDHGSGLRGPRVTKNRVLLEQYRRVAVGLARHMSDAFVANMLLHSCTLYIEGCALKHHIQKDQGKYFLIRDADAERARDSLEKKLAVEDGMDVPLPLDGDVIDDYYLAPHWCPVWLRERSAVAETFAITSFELLAGWMSRRGCGLPPPPSCGG